MEELDRKVRKRKRKDQNLKEKKVKKKKDHTTDREAETKPKGIGKYNLEKNKNRIDLVGEGLVNILQVLQSHRSMNKETYQMILNKFKN